MAERETLRTMKTEDVPAAFQLSAQAGWNQTEEDWRTLLELAPKTCLAIEVDGQLAATTTLLCYGRRLAWIGMVLTKVEFQRRGFAKALFREALKRADEMEIETIKLDATKQGQPLYEQFGFRGEEEIVRWSRQNSGTEPLPVVRSSTPVWRHLDANYFGADRLSLLERLAEKNAPAVREHSYLYSRPGRASAYLGPCVSDNPEDARTLISARVQNSQCSWYWDLFPGNRHAASVARHLGFTPQRHLLRMARGKELCENRDAIYAIAGFELG
ncbi:MAG: GNAT family N-acetyltransferase [Candidatus Sulfotelmatobacter sp.]